MAGAGAKIKLAAGVIEISAVEQDDGCGDEIQCGSSGLLVLMAAIAEATKPVECNGARKGVARLALVALRSNLPAERGVLEPPQSEERALDPTDLA